MIMIHDSICCEVSFVLFPFSLKRDENGMQDSLCGPCDYYALLFYESLWYVSFALTISSYSNV